MTLAYARVELAQQMIGVLVLAKLEVDDAIDAQLLDTGQSLGAQVFADFHAEAARQSRALAHEFRQVDPNAGFDQQQLLHVRLGKFQQK